MTALLRVCRASPKSSLVAGRWLRLFGRPRSTPASLRRVAAEYAVPVLPLTDAVGSGVLAEFGLSDQQLERARSVLVRVT